ncbi:diaminobutyrate acetyltransferase [Cellulosimicrobium protaetiae]|uniref:L-2,4-diaminobutyric acid acetyltransferase n=1 Tax=Cellulosimicrobium protaetiae TaxID=2587808 RepID=A0A6M5UIN6_9MICO|nr:diaminobutyrate acetyltransferase [Cellulosimicrobium protaetiae]QJW38010.1 diaminobutyrate acetyltransferase [Cellulosimicrobium protaetiae]
MDTTTNAAPTAPSTPPRDDVAPQTHDDERSPRIVLRRPAADDGAGMWRVARDSGELDLNSSYAYLLLAQHFADTCRVAVHGDRVVGFVSGYRLPDDVSRLFVWQVAVDEGHRGRGVAGRLLDAVVDAAPDVSSVTTTVAEDNTASRALFVRWAARRGATITTRPLFTADQFPDAHVDEPMLVIEGVRSR